MILTVKTIILYLLEDAIKRHRLNSQNLIRNLRVYLLFLVTISQRRNRAIYQQRNQCTYIFFLMHLTNSINKSTIINLFYRPWHQYYIICVIYMRRNISSGADKILFWKFIIKVKWTSTVLFFWDITKKKTKKYSIIVLKNGINPRHMIYFGTSQIIQLCVCYQTCRIVPIILLQFAVNRYLIPILKLRFHSHSIY